MWRSAVFDISLEKICLIIQRSRQFEAKVPAVDSDPDSNPLDDMNVGVLEFHPDDPILEELTSFIDDLNDDEQLDLVTLMWIGRGTYASTDWEEARRVAAAERTHKTSEYLLGTPLLPDYLEDAISQFGESCEGQALAHL